MYSLFSCPHITPRPEKRGKIYWLSGPPGSGKSTTCQLMAKKKDFRFYEADSMMTLVNPFVDINLENVGKAFLAQKPLKVSYWADGFEWCETLTNNFQGVSYEDAKAVLSSAKVFDNMSKGQVDGLDELTQPLLRFTCTEIVKQKKRLGGDFAVAQAVMSRNISRLQTSLSCWVPAVAKINA